MPPDHYLSSTSKHTCAHSLFLFAPSVSLLFPVVRDQSIIAPLFPGELSTARIGHYSSTNFAFQGKKETLRSQRLQARGSFHWARGYHCLGRQRWEETRKIKSKHVLSISMSWFSPQAEKKKGDWLPPHLYTKTLARLWGTDDSTRGLNTPERKALNK